MKTKSYKIYTGEAEQQTWIEVSETQDADQIILRINGGGVIRLSHKAWGELCAMKYELQCNEPGMEASQVPKLASEADTLSGEAEFNVDLPIADGTIKRLKREIEDV